MLNPYEQNLLQEARDSSIRTEERVNAIKERLEDGDLRFDDHEQRIGRLERKDLSAVRKQRWLVVIVSAITAGVTAILALLGRK